MYVCYLFHLQASSETSAAVAFARCLRTLSWKDFVPLVPGSPLTRILESTVRGHNHDAALTKSTVLISLPSLVSSVQQVSDTWAPGLWDTPHSCHLTLPGHTCQGWLCGTGDAPGTQTQTHTHSALNDVSRSPWEGHTSVTGTAGAGPKEGRLRYAEGRERPEEGGAQGRGTGSQLPAA